MSIFDKIPTNEGYSGDPFAPLNQIQETEPEWEWKPLERMKASGKETVGTLFGLGGAALDSMGMEGAASWASNKAGEWFDDAAQTDIVRTQFDEISNPLDAAKWTAELVTDYLPDIGMMFLGGVGFGTAAARAGGTKLGTSVVKTAVQKGFKKNLDKIAKEATEYIPEKELYKMAAKETARDVGSLLGVSAFEGGQGAGQAYLTEREQLGGEEASGLRSLGVGASQMAISMLNPMNKLLAGRLPKNKAHVLEMTIGEAAEETGQEAIAMAHEAGIDPNMTFGELVSSEEGAMRLLESGIAGAVLGGTFGGGLKGVLGKEVKEAEPKEGTKEWETNLQEIISERPEQVLEEVGIDTSMDPKGVGYEPPELSKVGLEKDLTTKTPPTTTEQDNLMDYEMGKYAGPEVTPEEFKPSPEVFVREGQTAQTTPRTADAIKNQMMDHYTQAYANNELTLPKPKRVTNLAQKQANKVALQEAKKNPEAVAYKPEETEPTTRRVYVSQPRKKVKTDKEGWVSQGGVHTLEVGNEEGDRVQVTKNNNESWTAKVKREDVGDYHLGTFKSLGDAKKAYKNNQTSEEFYAKEAKPEVALNATQKARIEEMDTEKAIGIAINKTALTDDPDAQSVAYEALTDAAKTFKEGKGTSFQSYATTVTIGKLRDYKKNKAATDLQEQTGVVTQGKEGDVTGDLVQEVSTEQALDMESAVDFDKDTSIEVTIPSSDGKITLYKQGKNYVTKDGKDYGTRKDDAILKAKEELTPKAKSISVEEYMAEKKGKATAKATTKEPEKKLPTNLKERKKVITRKKEETKKTTTKTDIKTQADKLGTDMYDMTDAEILAEYNRLEKEYRSIDSKSKIPQYLARYKTIAEANKETLGPNVETMSLTEFDKLSEQEQNKIFEEVAEDAVKAMEEGNEAYKLPKVVQEYRNREKELAAEKGEPTPRTEWLNSPKSESGKELHAFLNRSKTAKDLLNYIRYVDTHYGAEVSKPLRILNKYVSNQARHKLGGIKVYDRSKFKEMYPKHWKKYKDGKTLAQYFYFDGKLFLNKGRLIANHTDEEVVQTLVHEVVHAVTVKEMETEKGQAIKKNLEELLDEVRDKLLTVEEYNLLSLKYGWDSNKVVADAENFRKEFNRLSPFTYYAMLDPKEFMSEAFSNKEFQQALASIPLEKPQGTIRTVWDKFVKMIANILGFDKASDYTALDKVITSATGLMNIDPESGDTFMDIPPSIAPKIEVKPQNWNQRAKIMRENTTERRPKDYAIEGFEGVKKLGRELLKSSSEVLRKIDPKLIKPIRKFEMNIVERNVKSRAAIKEFVDKYSTLSVDDKNILDLTLMNNTPEDIKKRNQILQKNGMTRSFEKVRGMLQQMYNEKGELGLNQYGEIENYFPRRVKDMDGLMRAIYEDDDYNVIKAELDALGEEASREDKEHAVRQMINTGRFPAISFLKTTSEKKRKIQRVSSKWKHFYESTPEALLNHIYETNEKLAAHNMFADSPARNKQVKRRDTLYKQLEEGTAKNKEKAVAELQFIEDWLKNPEREWEGLDKYLAEIAPNLSQEDSKTVINIVRARLNQRGMHGPLGSIRNIALMSALGSPTSAITQIGDLAFSIYKNGPAKTVKAMFGNKVISAKDLDLEHSMKEFQTEGTAKWLDKVLTISGLKHMDLFGKNVSINASLNKAKSQTLEEFSKQWTHALGKDTEQTYKDIKAGKNTELSRYFVFNDLSNWQPISLSEMPQKYLEAGNGRLFYALKSYNIKAINNIYRESVHAWRTSETKAEKAKAAKNVGYLVLLMTMAGATADELKDLLLGRSADTFSDNVHENLLKIAFMSRYTLDQGFSKGFTETLAKDILVPPTGWIDDPFKDIYKMFSEDKEPDWKTLQSLPWGKLPYEWFTTGAEKAEMDRIRKKIYARVKDGDPISSVRKQMVEYNKWAVKNDKKPITIKSLNKAKRSS